MDTYDTISALFQLSRPADSGVTESGFILTQQELQSETGFAIPGAEPLIERILEEARPREIQLLLEKFGPFDQYSPGEVVAQIGYKIYIGVWTGDEVPLSDFDLIRQMELDIIGRSDSASPDEFYLWRDSQSGKDYQIGKVHDGASEQPLDQMTLHLLSQPLTESPGETRASNILRQLLEQAKEANFDLYSQGASLKFGYGVSVVQDGFELVLHDNEVQGMQSHYEQQYGSKQNRNWPLIIGISVGVVVLVLIAGILLAIGRSGGGERPSSPARELTR